MHLNVSQQMRMAQQMKLAPRMIQSMEILQLPLMALQERIDQELSENVCLEQVERKTDDGDFGSEQGGDPFEVAPRVEIDRQELVAGKEDNNASDFERLVEISQEWPEDNYTSGSRTSGNQMDDDADRQHDVMSNAESRPQTLTDYLVDQFHYFNVDAEERAFGEYLIQNLDDNGRLQSSLPELTQVFGQSMTLPRAENVLKLIQKLDPPGVGARDLKECLLLQIKPETPLRESMITLISLHLDDLLQNRLPLIERKTGYTLDEIKSAMEQMRTLDPFPGKGFAKESVQTVSPDLRVDKDETGKWGVSLIEEYIPQLRISQRYLRMLEGNPDQKTKEFIKRKIESAKWLIDSIEQRYNTLKRVAQEIVNRQSEFLEQGPDHIVPLKMQDIADVVHVHVTTVSRAVDDKYIVTPRGIYPLKRFFGGGTKTDDGEEVAWDIIRIKLKEVVDNENKSNPMSDDDIVDALKAQGYTLARRTVTKYRKALNIPSSRQRKVF